MAVATEVWDLFSAQSVKKCIGLHELQDCCQTWRQFGAEFLGTFILVLVGCGSTVEWTKDCKPTPVEISLAFGLIVACVVQVMGPVSGAHVNPAVTVGLLVGGHVFVARALMYIAAQCAGAVAGAVVLKVLTPFDVGLGVTSLHVTPVQGWFVEALITGVLVMTVLSSCVGARRHTPGSAPFAIGLSITACHLFAIPYTGASMNPARSLGPAMIKESWDNHWVYWAGPLVGSIAAALVFRAFYLRPSLDESAETTGTEDSMSITGRLDV